MKKLLLFFCPLLILCLENSCTNIEYDLYSRIYGVVADAETNDPVQGAIVTLSPGGKTTVSGSDGMYEFTDLDILQYTIMVQKEGYQTNRKVSMAVTGESVRADIMITKID